MTTQALIIAERFSNAVVSGNTIALEALLASNFTLWQASTDHTRLRRDAIDLIRSLSDSFPGFFFEDVRRTVSTDVFVQQHVARGVSSVSGPFAVYVCMIGRIGDGQIHRLEEYFDASQVPTAARNQ